MGDTGFYKDFISVRGKEPLVCVSEFPRAKNDKQYERRIAMMFHFLSLPVPGDVVWTDGFDDRIEAVVNLTPIVYFDCNDRFIEALREKGINAIKTSENTEFWSYLDNHEENELPTTQEFATTLSRNSIEL